MVYRHKISDIDQLKRVLINCWAQLIQDVHIEPWDRSAAKTLVIVIKAMGARVEFSLD